MLFLSNIDFAILCVVAIQYCCDGVQAVHMMGVGDYGMHHVTVLPDPCPLPKRELKRTLRYAQWTWSGVRVSVN